ncbi:putative serine protein kinase [Coniella lustricola]|uniref:non-specific serine/threonine protein kinase n=1 Tax=Coniella lustricola TaxID=2025994 RepID=A0A2T3A399_9PEZI|nr:putative serine protein kinase [Coniella lustricola]
MFLRGYILGLYASRTRCFYFPLLLDTPALKFGKQRNEAGAMSTSRPPTPPQRAPIEEDWRFKELTAPCEWVEAYRPGGYHPVVLGDVFNDGQYKIVRKLGDGSFSTVWLVRDSKNNRYVALKILVSEISRSTNEPQILHDIAKVTKTGVSNDSRHVTQLLDEFEHQGPNGHHKCLVFEPMGPTVNSMVEELPQFKPRTFNMTVRYPPKMAKSILKQSLQGLAFLHGLGIAHGDFQPGNMLFPLRKIDSKPEAELQQNTSGDSWESIPVPVERIDGKKDEWAPPYLYISQPLVRFANYSPGFKIKLSDMGAAYYFSDPPKEPVTPSGLRPPELVLSGVVHKSLDVWSFGCLIFELLTGWPLFLASEDDEHILNFIERLGPLPDELFEHWKTSSLYFTPERKLFNCEVGRQPEEGSPLMLEQQSMEAYFDEAKPDLDAAEAKQVKALIRRVLQYEPANRPSASDLLLDPWFCAIDNKG